MLTIYLSLIILGGKLESLSQIVYILLGTAEYIIFDLSGNITVNNYSGPTRLAMLQLYFATNILNIYFIVN